jgi:polysaccharide export outer membrane protein
VKLLNIDMIAIPRLFTQKTCLVALGVFLLSSSAMAIPELTPEQMQKLQQLSPDQVQKLQQLSPEQQAALAKQTSASPAATATPAAATPAAATPAAATPAAAPDAVKPRDVGNGPLEAAPVGKDEKAAAADAKKSPVADVPVVEVPTQKAADAQATRRSFEDFLREAKPMTVDTQNLQQFGYELFSGQPSSFAPTDNVPVPAEYVLGPGDEIKVQLFGKDNTQLTLTVDREGLVAFPQVGPVTLSGLSFAQAKTTLTEIVAQKMIGNTASITMGQLRSIRIFALGDVFRPGSYTVSGLATLSHALFSSGGVKKIGSLRNIQLKRNGQPVVALDLYDFLLRGDTSKDQRLLPGDVVFVPPILKTVSIAGEVARPAIYEIKNEKTVGDVVRLAGGLMPKAYLDRALIERLDGKGEKKIVDIRLAGKGLLTPVQNGDIIKVFSGSEFETNQVLLIGNVKRPGTHAWQQGVRISSLVSSSEDLLPESFTDYGIIEREAPDNREPTLIRFRLGEVLASGGKNSAADLLLNARDKVYVFKRANFREQPQVSISGTVPNSGSFEFKRNMHLADLVLAAGGVMRDTDLGEVEIYRTDPVSKKISLLKANLAGAMASNPENDIVLQDLDRVVIHSIYETKLRNMVSIDGQVHKPATVTLTQGMRVADLVFAGGSVTEFAFLKKATLTRYAVENGEKRAFTTISIDLAAALRGDETANLLLEPYDTLYITRINEEPNTRNVSVSGEVRKPVPSMPLVVGMRISDLVFAGGGLTEFAFSKKATLTRYAIKNGEKRAVKTVNVDLLAALRGDEAANILLEPYDALSVARVNDEPNTRTVTIAGEVRQPVPSMALVEGMRISDLLFAGGGLTEFAFLKTARLTRYSYQNGEKRTPQHYNIDLSGVLRGDEKANLLLEPYDALYISRINDEPNTRDMVSVGGEVYHPTAVPLVPGMRITDLVFAGGGVTDAVYLDKAEVTRYTIENGERRVSDHFEVNLAAALHGDASANILLQPYDILNVRRLGNWRPAEQVEIIGEVAHPGKYPVEDGERLSSLLIRAGGYSKFAYLPAAVFTRVSVQQQQTQQLSELAQRMESELAQLVASNSTTTDELLKLQRQNGIDAATRVVSQLKGTKATGRLVIQLSDIAELKDSEFDLRLRAGDQLTIPKQPDDVLVLGEVYTQNAILFNSGISRSEYVRQAGPTRMADTDAVYVIHVNGQVDESDSGFFTSGRKIGPGDVVVVPPNLRYINALDIALDWSRALMQIGMTMATGKAIGVFK